MFVEPGSLGTLSILCSGAFANDTIHVVRADHVPPYFYLHLDGDIHVYQISSFCPDSSPIYSFPESSLDFAAGEPDTKYGVVIYHGTSPVPFDVDFNKKILSFRPPNSDSQSASSEVDDLFS